MMILTDSMRHKLAHEHIRNNRSFAACADILERDFGVAMDVDDVHALWNDLVKSGWLDANGHKPRDRKVRPTERELVIRANIMHLVDLKRAGHSPKDTEYTISEDGTPFRFETHSSKLYGGSPAASCAELG